MTEQEAIAIIINTIPKTCKMVNGRLKGGYDDWDSQEGKAIKVAIDVFEEIQQYRAIGTVEECRAAVEKQKEMIAYCDENDCSDCPYHGGSQKENRCMNDFIADEIVKGGGVNERNRE